jgi:hypothetical protein
MELGSKVYHLLQESRIHEKQEDTSSVSRTDLARKVYRDNLKEKQSR